MVMDSIISKNQSTFIKSQFLVDRVVVVNEVVDLANRLKNECLIFKMDSEKAYESVSWRFLDYMLVRYGFRDRWSSVDENVRIIVICQFSLMFSNERCEYYKGHNGDPLAPFLFLSVAEGLGSLICKAVSSTFPCNLNAVSLHKLR
jgi:hypothetical protein